MFLVSPHICRVSVLATSQPDPIKRLGDIPYMPVGATTNSLPNAALPVPARSLKDSLSPEVIGAGSNPADLWDTVMCLVELWWDGDSKNEIV